MKDFLITIIAPDERKLSPADEAKCITEYSKWAKKLGDSYILGRRLALNEGTLIPKKESIVTDGPFIEGKELIAGIVLIKAKDLLKARKLASTCPLNSYFHLFVKEAQ